MGDLERPEGLTELLSFLDVLDRLIQGTLGKADPVGGDIGPGSIKEVHELSKAFSFSPYKIFLGDSYVTKRNTGCVSQFSLSKFSCCLLDIFLFVTELEVHGLFSGNSYRAGASPAPACAQQLG